MITRLAISGYRSLRNVTLALGPLNIITGANGSGKSSLYRALRLLADVAKGRVVASLAAECGLSSTLWAGPEKFSREMKSGVHPVQSTRRLGPISLKLGFASDDYGYAIDLGLPQPSPSRFALDPEIKVAAVWIGNLLGRANLFAERRGPRSRLLGKAAESCQIIFVSHAPQLVVALSDSPDSQLVVLEKQLGETIVRDAEPPPWKWPSRS